MTTEMRNKNLGKIVLSSFLTEVNALKPGNVSRYAGGHGMTIEDFVLSAELVSPILCSQKLSLGERVLQSIKITREKAGCNTNLGMVLLFAPIIMAAEKTRTNSDIALQNNLKILLEAVNKTDSRLIFQAIREASPGGLGHSDKFDVNSLPDCSLQEAMTVAQERDFIAKQYVTGFSDIFMTGLACIKEFTSRWNRVEWATVACYLTFLAGFADSHVVRKFGNQVAEQTRIKAIAVVKQFKQHTNPDNAVTALLEFDRELKNLNINPGTSADLTAASVLVYELSSTGIADIQT
jgi:triphosphoribosyl-dephospho-CoA synthase